MCHWEVVSFNNLGQLEVSYKSLGGKDEINLLSICYTGSGSAYIYGYCDSNWKEGWGKEQTLEFVRNGELTLLVTAPFFIMCLTLPTSLSALSLAMSRDGSSGGTIRMADITEKGVERHFVPGDKLPVLSAKIV